MFRKFTIATIIAAAVFATGCASVPTANVERDNKAKSFVASPGKANIYVC